MFKERKEIARMSAFTRKCLNELDEGARIIICGLEVEIQCKVIKENIGTTSHYQLYSVFFRF